MPTEYHEEHQEAVLVGIILSPALLTAIPFIDFISQIVSSVTVVSMLLFSAAGAIWFRNRYEFIYLLRWKLILAALLSIAFLTSSLYTAYVSAGALVALAFGIAFICVLAWACRFLHHPGNQFSPKASAVAGAMGAGFTPVMSYIFGQSIFSFFAAALHITLAIVTALMLLKTHRKLRAAASYAT